jgi:hypothetical protein
MTTLRWLTLYALTGALATTGCTATNPGLEPGSTEFITEEPEYDDHSSGGPTSGASDMGSFASADAGNTTGNDPAPGAPMGRTGTVEEGNIYRVDHDRLFYFNTYKGLLIYDLADAQHPRRISRVPVYGYPIEMYVSGDRVYALLRDALYLTQDAAGQKFEEHRTSQLVTIDISDLANPKVLKTIDIVGQLREGVSRKIDDTIYVVSYIPQGYYGWWSWNWGWYGQIDTEKEQAWAYSFNVADPASPQLVDKLKIFEGGGSYGSTGGGGTNRYFQDVAISATSNTLHVVENWQTYGWVPYGPEGCGASFSHQQAVVSLVDISDPTGHIRLHTKFDTYGRLNDQFKMSYRYDPVRQRGYYYGIFQRREWASIGCSGDSFTQNSFQTWDVTDGQNPTRVGFLPFGKPNETVGGSVFDMSRQVTFAITSRTIDPLYAIGFADPAAPEILSAIDGLSGDMSVFTLIGGNQFLLGIGRDPNDSCTGFATGSTGWGTGVSVSIFDVKDVRATRLVQRRCVDVANADWVTSQANWNLDQGHKMIGLLSDARASVVTVPVDYSRRNDQASWWWYDHGSAVGMMSLDLAAYDPSKSELDQRVLANHGSFKHTQGTVRRTIAFSHESSGGRRMVLNLSDTHMSLWDIEDLDAPALKSELELAPNVQELYRFGDYMVEHVREPSDTGSYYSAGSRSDLRVKPIGGTLDDTAPVATFSVGQVQRVLKWKDALVVFRVKDGTSWPYSSGTQLVVYDLSTPATPVLRSITDLGFSTYAGYSSYWFGPWGYCGGWWWNSTSDWLAFDGGVVFQRTVYETWDHPRRSLVHVDLSDLGAPRLNEHDLDLGDERSSNIMADAADPTGFFVTRKQHVGDKPGHGSYKMALYKYYAQRWHAAGGDIEVEGETNLPGRLVRSWKSGDTTLLVSQDDLYTWRQNESYPDYWSYASEPRIHLLERTGGEQATLRDSHLFAGRYLSSLVAAGDRLHVGHGLGYSYYRYDDPARDTTEHLAVFDLRERKLTAAFDGSLGIDDFTLMGGDEQHLYLRLPSAGVLVLDTSDAQRPRGQTFLRTLGWGSHLEVSGTTMYVAAGQFGVFQRSLVNQALPLMP